MNNIQIVVFLYIILRVIIFIVFFVSIIGCHFILCYINSFLYSRPSLFRKVWDQKVVRIIEVMNIIIIIMNIIIMSVNYVLFLPTDDAFFNLAHPKSSVSPVLCAHFFDILLFPGSSRIF